MPEKTNKARELLEEFRTIAGNVGLLDTILPPVLFLALNGWMGFQASMIGSLGLAVLIALLRLSRKQSLLYVPQHLPEPRNPAFTRAAAEEVVRILQHSRGRAFVLFTSYQQMRLVHDKVSLAIEYPTLLQGTGPRSALLDEFRATPHCVLFATSSFWQ